MHNILITDLVHELLINGLRNAGFEIDYRPNISYDEVFNCIENYEGIIINSKILVSQRFLDNAIRLKFVARLGSGLEIIDLDYAKAKGIVVINSPEGNRNAVAEHALGMLLALANNLVAACTEVENFKWNREANRGFEIEGKTIGIIGYGNTGESFARKFLGWNVRILVYDKYKPTIDTYNGKMERVSLEELLENAQIISIHLPLNAETKYYVNDIFFQKWTNAQVLINTSRGKILETKALIENLSNGKLRGACLDVFENEKPETYSSDEISLYKKLFSFKNLIVSPHIAGWTEESKENLSKILLDRILLFYS